MSGSFAILYDYDEHKCEVILKKDGKVIPCKDWHIKITTEDGDGFEIRHKAEGGKK